MPGGRRQRVSHNFGGDWTERKLEMLAKYLNAYTKVLKNRHFQTAYIDAFAGTGYRTATTSVNGTAHLLFPDIAENDSQTFLDGSARIALRTEPPFNRYIFIESNAERCRQLDQLRDDFPTMADRIEVQQANANAAIRLLCRKENWRSHRAVLFLDPYGMQVEWATLEEVARTGAIDLWILFPLGIGVNRLLTRSRHIPESWRSRLNLLLGNETWFDELYEVKVELSLFGGEQERVVKASTATIGRYFNERLASIFPGVAPNPCVLRNSRHNPMYLLCFAVANRDRGKDIALKIAEHILEDH